MTQGQPWLTNSILKKCVWDFCPDGQEVLADHIREAKERLIQQRAVHLGSLTEWLRDPWIKRVVQTILTGDSGPAIANPIYREVIARVLRARACRMPSLPRSFPWKQPDGRLDLDALLREFQKFWRRHADLWEAKTDYTEAFLHLLLMAFLQRVINGGGRVEREYAAGRGRMDLAVLYGGAWSIIEIKLVIFDRTPAGRILAWDERLI